MKKTLSLVVILLAFSSLAVNQNVWAGQGQMAPESGFPSGANCRQQPTVDPKIHQQFMEATEGLRGELMVKRSAYVELMNSATPDKETAQQMWSEMFDLQTQIRVKATELGVSPMELCIEGPGPCNGTGTPRCKCQNSK
jgi:Spy/CpxP family protein refolding chaperone